jgi:hypothetical protein
VSRNSPDRHQYRTGRTECHKLLLNGFREVSHRNARHKHPNVFREVNRNNVSIRLLNGFREANRSNVRHLLQRGFKEVHRRIVSLHHKADRVLKAGVIHLRNKKMEEVARIGPLEVTKAKNS